jgi:UDP-N-acetylmuramyl pentapeptide phosphotransferase/UDP-N-acetylglucosamine-1-phosphate transferase
MLNLLDLRPGRAIKGFLIFLFLIAILGLGDIDWLLLAPLLGAVLYYLLIDLRAGAMMGDAGSNVLGLTLGYLCVISLACCPGYLYYWVSWLCIGIRKNIHCPRL